MPALVSRTIPQRLHDALNPGVLLPGVTSGIIMGITEVIFAISLGSLVFSGELTALLPRGIGMVLFTAAVMTLVTSLFSKVPAVIGSAQDTSSVMLAVIAAGLVTTTSRGDPQNLFVTVLVAIAAATLLTGLFFVALGSLKLGGFVRYIPYPVVGGFLAGTGWLLVQGSFGVMTGSSLEYSVLSHLLKPELALLWAPGVIFALSLFFGLRTIKHTLALPGILIGGVIVFYISITAMGISIAEAVQKGLLLGQLSGGESWKPLVPSDLLKADWTAILGQSGNIGIILILSLVGLLLNATALELAIRKDVDFNRELQAAGVSNIISGLGGGMVGYQALSLSALSYRLGARGRVPGIIAGGICLLLLVFGTGWLAYFPKPVLGGLLLFLGLDFLSEWLLAGWKKLSRADYGVVVLILIIIATTNFLIGVGTGLVAAIILFVWSYSRIDVVYHVLSGAELHSNVERCTFHRRALTESGSCIHILELQGFIFFGTGITLLERIRIRVYDPQQAKVRYLILDFRRVSGIDSSAGLSFDKAIQLAEAHGIILVLTHLPEKLLIQLGLEEKSEKRNSVRVFPDLDSGLEWCEEQLLEMNMITGLHTPVALVAQLSDSGFQKANTTRLKEFLERIQFKKGDFLISQGEEADSLYFIEFGSVSVYLETENGKQIRLQTFGLGTAVGELDLYQGVKCTASVTADTPGTAYRLSRAALSAMKEKEPELAATFHEFIAHTLSERLAAATRTLEAVIR